MLPSSCSIASINRILYVLYKRFRILWGMCSCVQKQYAENGISHHVCHSNCFRYHHTSVRCAIFTRTPAQQELKHLNGKYPSCNCPNYFLIKVWLVPFENIELSCIRRERKKRFASRYLNWFSFVWTFKFE